MVFNATFNNVSVTSWWSVLMVEETGIPRENNRSHMMYLFFNITEEVSTLFRATSLATTLMDQYMKMTASQFVSDAIKEYILKIIDSKQS
jgi:uncharacterized protein YggT (Ycf19 family)